MFLGALSSSGLQSHGRLKGVVDPPLESGQSTDHNNSCAQTSPKSLETNVCIDLLNGISDSTISLDIVQLRNDGISRVGDNGAEDSCQITRGEGNRELSSSRVLVLGLLVKDSLVDLLHDFFKGHELHNGVRHLTAPKRDDSLVETKDT